MTQNHGPYLSVIGSKLLVIGGVMIEVVVVVVVGGLEEEGVVECLHL